MTPTATRIDGTQQQATGLMIADHEYTVSAPQQRFHVSYRFGEATVCDRDQARLPRYSCHPKANKFHLCQIDTFSILGETFTRIL